jgi:hypothetical protein
MAVVYFNKGVKALREVLRGRSSYSINYYYII